MRIFHMLAGAPSGGAETFALDAIVALADRGVEQHVAARPHPLVVQRLHAARVAFTPVSYSPFSRWLGAPGRLAAQAREFKADLIHAWMGRAASFVPADRPCPALGWFGGYYDLKRYRECDWLVGVTPDIASHIRKAGAPADRVGVVHTFGTLPYAAPLDRDRFEVPANAPLLLTLSRMHKKKGIDTLLDALRQLPDVHVLLAGDGPLLDHYRRLAVETGVGDQAHFLGWRTDRAALLATADICVLPSHYEPFGTVIAEAWASRRPLITSNAQGARQFVKDHVNGLVFRAGHIGGLVAAVKEMVASKQLQADLAEAGFQTYQQNFSRDVVMDTLIETYQKAIRAGRKA